MGLAMDVPSTINYQRPFFGGTLSWIGKAEAQIEAEAGQLLNATKAIVPIANKTVDNFEKDSKDVVANAPQFIIGGFAKIVNGTVNGVRDFLVAGKDLLKGVVAGTVDIASPAAAPLKFVVLAIVAGAVIYGIVVTPRFSK